MTIAHWVERGAKWMMGLIVGEMAKHFLRRAFAWMRGWVRRALPSLLSRAKRIFENVGIQMLEQMFEGSIGILGFAPAAIDVTYAPYFGAGALQAHRCRSEVELQRFLESSLAILKDKVTSALETFRATGSARIDNVFLTDEQVLRHGLDSTPLRQMRSVG